MANTIYPKYKEALINGGANTSLAGTVKMVLVDGASYTYNAAHDFFDDVSGVISTVTLANKTYTNGVFDADDATFTAVSAGTYEILIIYIDTGAAATSRLVHYCDVATGLPVTSNTNDIPVVFDSGANKIFAL